jgi:hypothetical protein
VLAQCRRVRREEEQEGEGRKAGWRVSLRAWRAGPSHLARPADSDERVGAERAIASRWVLRSDRKQDTASMAKELEELEARLAAAEAREKSLRLSSQLKEGGELP